MFMTHRPRKVKVDLLNTCYPRGAYILLEKTGKRERREGEGRGKEGGRKERRKGRRRWVNSDACPEENETGMCKHRIETGEMLNGKDREEQQRR